MLQGGGVFVLLFIITQCCSSVSYFGADKVLSNCLAEPPTCTSYDCLAGSRRDDIRRLSSLRCQGVGEECLSARTGLYCRTFSSGSFCDCPLGHAYDPRECACKQAEPCYGASSCHNEMKCASERCSCKGLNLGGEALFEPHGRLCVLPRVSSEVAFTEYFHHQRKGGSLSGAAIGLIVVTSLVFLSILLAILIRWSLKGGNGSLTCKKGDYDCEEDAYPGGGEAPLRRNDVHVAAWDLPSLDYLTEEEAALKYIKKERRSPDEGSSLPECEQSHINAGYISDNN